MKPQPHGGPSATDSEAQVVKLNGKRHKAVPAPDAYQETLTSIQQKKEQLASENARRQQEMADLTEQEKQATEAHKQELRDQRDMYRNMAQNYRELAKEADSKDQADELLRYAMECDRDAAKIIIEGEPQEGPLTVDAPKPTPKPHWGWAVLQAVLLLAVLGYGYGMFDEFKRNILAGNAAALQQAARDGSTPQITQPYDDVSFQKFFFEKLVEFSDLPSLLIKLLIISPFLLGYLLPYVRSRKDFITEFFEELTPFQRCLLTVILVLGFLLHSVFSHLIKP